MLPVATARHFRMTQRRVSESTTNSCIVTTSAGKVRFGSGSEPLALNAEPEPGVRFRPPPNLEPVRAFRFGSGPNAVQT